MIWPDLIWQWYFQCIKKNHSLTILNWGFLIELLNLSLHSVDFWTNWPDLIRYDLTCPDLTWPDQSWLAMNITWIDITWLERIWLGLNLLVVLNLRKLTWLHHSDLTWPDLIKWSNLIWFDNGIFELLNLTVVNFDRACIKMNQKMAATELVSKISIWPQVCHHKILNNVANLTKKSQTLVVSWY